MAEADTDYAYTALSENGFSVGNKAVDPWSCIQRAEFYVAQTSISAVKKILSGWAF